MFSSSDIEKMDFEQLRSAVASINNEFEKFKRDYREKMENIDSENLSDELYKKIYGE